MSPDVMIPPKHPAGGYGVFLLLVPLGSLSSDGNVISNSIAQRRLDAQAGAASKAL